MRNGARFRATQSAPNQGHDHRAGHAQRLLLSCDNVDRYVELRGLELADLYFQRWDVELFFRDIKTT
jgi:hypothetical protein